MNLKYIIVREPLFDVEIPIVFSDRVSHKVVAGDMKVVGAGFINERGDVFGNSVSLLVESRPKDAEILKRVMTILPAVPVLDGFARNVQTTTESGEEAQESTTRPPACVTGEERPHKADRPRTLAAAGNSISTTENNLPQGNTHSLKLVSSVPVHGSVSGAIANCQTQSNEANTAPVSPGMCDSRKDGHDAPGVGGKLCDCDSLARQTPEVSGNWPNAVTSANGSPQTNEPIAISNTESQHCNQLEAVGGSVDSPKGLGTDGNKPLMRNRSGDVMPISERNTASNTLSGGVEMQTRTATSPVVRHCGREDNGAKGETRTLPNVTANASDSSALPAQTPAAANADASRPSHVASGGGSIYAEQTKPVSLVSELGRTSPPQHGSSCEAEVERHALLERESHTPLLNQSGEATPQTYPRYFLSTTLWRADYELDPGKQWVPAIHKWIGADDFYTLGWSEITTAKANEIMAN